jgi:hypothetical protein
MNTKAQLCDAKVKVVRCECELGFVLNDSDYFGAGKNHPAFVVARKNLAHARENADILQQKLIETAKIQRGYNGNFRAALKAAIR